MLHVLKNISKDGKILYYSDKLSILIIVNPETKQVDHIFCGLQSGYLFPLLSTIESVIVKFGNNKLWNDLYGKCNDTITMYLTGLSTIEENQR